MVAGGASLIQIEGETGFGKTRLLDELTAQLDGMRFGRAGGIGLPRLGTRRPRM